jgi:hypothetical protein
MWKGLASDWFIEPYWRKPSLRPNRAEMSPAAFLGLVVIWGGAVSAILCVATLARVFS